MNTYSFIRILIIIIVGLFFGCKNESDPPPPPEIFGTFKSERGNSFTGSLRSIMTITKDEKDSIIVNVYSAHPSSDHNFETDSIIYNTKGILKYDHYKKSNDGSWGIWVFNIDTEFKADEPIEFSFYKEENASGYMMRNTFYHKVN